MGDRSFPVLHPRPARGWVNDPNGLVHAGGRWHVFFQHNPDSARHDRICWGHISSADLVTWQEHPVALRPREGGPDAYGCWSGVVTLDGGVPTAVYSGVLGDDGRSQAVLARGSADLLEWSQDGTVAAGMPDDPGIVAVRDPFVFRFGGRRWAIQGAGLASGGPAVLLYGAEDLGDWEYHGVWLAGGAPGTEGLADADIWECPQLVEADGAWVLLVSLWRGRELTGVGHLVGDLRADPATGLPVFGPRASGLSDRGNAFYAPQAVQGPGRALLWGWAREEAPAGVRGRTQEESDAVGWSGLLTFPRELAVHGDAVELRPAPELERLRSRELPVPTPAEGAATVLALPDQAEAEVTGSDVTGTGTRGAGTRGAGTRFGPGTAQSGGVRLVLADVHTGSVQTLWEGDAPAGGTLRVLIDASIAEIHPSGGVATTLRAYPAPGEEYRLEVAAGLGVRAWELALPAPG